MNEMDENREERLEWFKNAKLGMFITWGCYAVTGRTEQIMLRDMIPYEEYEPIAQDFKPASDWATHLAQKAVNMGAKYVVLTTRHHDGYCLWDTKLHDFKATTTGPQRDLVAEFVQAAREAGLRVGLYFSVVSWRHRAFWDPIRYEDEIPQIVDEFHEQVVELMTGYGKIDILWYDIPQRPGQRTPGAFGQKVIETDMKNYQFYRSIELNKRVRELQPKIIINGRSGVAEDFETPEQHVTPAQEGRAWETCMTLNYAPGWSYLNHSVANKSMGEVLFNLVNAVRLGGNFLFDVGPMASGYLDTRCDQMVNEIGGWMKRYGEAIYDTKPTMIYPEFEKQGACFHYGMFTCKKNIAYLTVFYYPQEYLIISRLGPKIRRAELMPDAKPLKVEPLSNMRWKISGLPETCPDPLAPVIKIEFESEPYLFEWEGADWTVGQLKPLS